MAYHYDCRETIQRLTDWWQVDDLNALKSTLGLSPKENGLTPFLRGERYSISNTLLTAVTAFALAQL
jgi:hypothetical protein